MAFGAVHTPQDASRNGSSDEGVKGIDNTVNKAESGASVMNKY